MWNFTLRNLLGEHQKYIWVQIRILYETDKAVLVYTVTKIWIPKSQIHGIRLRNNVFEVCVKEKIVG